MTKQMKKLCRALLGALILGFSLCGVQTAALAATTLVSTGDPTQGTLGSDWSASNKFSLSADGTKVAFESYSTNLVAGDTNNLVDVFVRNLTTGTTTRVNLDSNGAQATGGDSKSPRLSADGTKVAFHSSATNLVAGDTNNRTDVFVRDLTTGTTTRVSVDSNGTQSTGGNSFAFSLSANGSKVAFQSDTTNLVAGDTNGQSDVFVRDLTAGTTTRVSVDSSGAQGNNASFHPILISDGSKVAFMSDASNLVAGDTNAQTDVFVRDLTTNTTIRVSVDSSGAQATGGSYDPSLSSDGSKVAFSSGASNLVAGDTNGQFDVFIRNLTTGTTTRVSVDSSGTQSTGGTSYTPSLSSDGSTVAFSSVATNLVAGDTNGQSDVFVRNLTTNATIRVSVDSSGAQATGGASYNPSLSSDGSKVTFESEASNLVSGDTNNRNDVFVSDVVFPLTLSINDVAMTEGNSGTTTFTFTVTRSSDTTNAITFNYTTSDGAATAGSDYVAVVNGSGSIAAGATTGTFTITINGDQGKETDETFNVTLSNPTGGAITTATGIGTITNDDSGLVVTTTADNADGNDNDNTLREAIAAAFDNAGADTITFNIPGTGVKTIQMASALPSITDSGTTIDGYTQPGSHAKLDNGTPAVIRIELKGTGNFDGLNIGANNCTVRGLALGNFNRAIVSGNGVTGSSITGNFVGTGADGTTVSANDTGVSVLNAFIAALRAAPVNRATGAAVFNAAANSVGGPGVGDGNLIANSIGAGITIIGSGNSITRNTLRSNGGDGIKVLLAFGNGTGNTLRLNNFDTNGGLPIDLNDDGADTNDALDADAGANNTQNFPVITSVRVGVSSTVLRGTLSSKANSSYTLDFYITQRAGTPNASTSLTALSVNTSVTTDGSGVGTFNFTAPINATQRVFYATATDDITGDTSELSAPSAIGVDTTRPNVTIASPTTLTAGQAFPPISGNVSDEVAGTVANPSVRVVLSILRAVDNLYYNGNGGWSATRTRLPTTITGDGGAGTTYLSNDGTLPAANQLSEGRYRIEALATDAAGNRTTAIRLVTYPGTAPTVSITDPTGSGDPLQVSTLPAVRGTAADGGSGLSRVMLSIQRVSDNKFWTGSAWGAPTPLSTTPNPLNGAASVNWERTTGLPAVTNNATTGLEEGKVYVLRAKAVDRAELASVATRRIKVVAPPIMNMRASSSGLATASASSSSSSVSVSFGSAVPAGDFAVTVNGANVKVQSVQPDGQSVTLLLAGSTLRPGDKVGVTWNGGGASAVAE